MLVRREPDLDDLSIPTLLLRLRAEQKESWLAGRPVDVTTYFREHPRIAADPEARFELIYHEVLVREELGERPDPAAYARAFPDLAERLRLQWEVHRALTLDGDADEPSLGYAGHPDTRGGLKSSDADIPFMFPDDARNAAEAVFEALVAFAVRWPDRVSLAHSPEAWCSVVVEINAFLKLQERSEKKAWFSSRGITLGDDLWRDISKGPKEDIKDRQYQLAKW